MRLSQTHHFVSLPFEVRTILVQVRAFYQRKIGMVWQPAIVIWTSEYNPVARGVHIRYEENHYSCSPHYFPARLYK